MSSLKSRASYGSSQKDETQFDLKTRDGDKYRDGYFLGHNYLKNKVGQRRVLGIAYNRFKCQDCQRIFHTDFGLKGHALNLHGRNISISSTAISKISPIPRPLIRSSPRYDTNRSTPTTRAAQKKKSKSKSKHHKTSSLKKVSLFGRNEEVILDDSSDSDIQEIDSDIEELPAFHIETAKVIAKDPGWNPKVILRDPYDYPETALALPPKPAAAVKKRSSKRIAQISEDIQIVDAEQDNAKSKDIVHSDDEIIELDTEDNLKSKQRAKQSSETDSGVIDIDNSPIKANSPDSLRIVVTPDISFGSDSDDSAEDNIIREPEAKKDYVRRVRSKSNNSIELVDDQVQVARAPVVVGTGQFTKLPAISTNIKSTDYMDDQSKIEAICHKNEKKMQRNVEDEDEDIILLD